jgi:Cytochrome P450
MYPFRNCTGPVSNTVDFVPFLQILPNKMATRGKKLHEGLVETYGGMILDIEARMRRGEHVPDCLVKTMILTKEEEQLDHLDMSILCAAFMIGGVETVSILTFVFLSTFSPLSRLLPSCNGLLRLSPVILIYRQKLTLSLIVLLAVDVCLQSRMRRICHTSAPS